MLSQEEAQLVKKRNYNRIKELIRTSYFLGVNLAASTCFKDSLKILNVILNVASLLSLYGHWSLLIRYINNVPKITETICTAFQTLISVVKLIYFLFVQNIFYELLYEAQTHAILQKIEIFHKEFPAKSQLKKEIDEIMENIWKDIRRQLVYYLCSCSAICCNYFFGALFVNLYHQLKETPNYVPMMPFPALYPIFEEKGMSFPYYHIEMFLGGAAVYISGIAAFSFDGVFIVLSMYGVGLTRVLNMMIKYSTTELIPKEERVECLRCCIYQYQRIWNYILQLNRIYKHVMLSQFLMSLVVLGIVLFQMSIGLVSQQRQCQTNDKESSKITFLRMVMYIMAAGYEIVLYCYNGARLTEALDEIPLSLYSCVWYNESKEFKKLLLMMILRTNRTFRIEISWFSAMSMPTLMTMIRTSGSYFLLLRNLAE